MNQLQEIESSLQKLLSTLKKNRECVPREFLWSRYRDDYFRLKTQISQTAKTYICTLLTQNLLKNPYISDEIQIHVINRAIQDSGLVPEMSRCINQTYSVDKLYPLVMDLKEQIQTALWPYIDFETCLVYDLEHPEQEPILYNRITRQVFTDGNWIHRELDLGWKFIQYLAPRPYEDTVPVQSTKPNTCP